MTLPRMKDSARFFHLSAMTISVILLAFAETPFPGGPFGFGLLGGSILVLFKMLFWPAKKDLSDPLGYILGGMIAVLGLGWILLRLHPYNTIFVLPLWLIPKDDLSNIPIQLAIIPCVGPLLPPLLIIKLSVRQLPRDFWVEQAMALAMVSIACMLCSDISFGIMLMVYFIVAMTAFALREQAYWRSQAGFDSDLGNTFQGFGNADGIRGQAFANQPWAPRITRWFWWSFLSSLALFFILPRFDIPSWDPLERFSPSKRANSGFANEVNTNLEGNIALSDMLAFTLEAKGSNGPAQLAPGQLFRGMYLDHYEKGFWTQKILRRGTPLPLQSRYSYIQPGQTHLTFRVNPSKVGGVFLADPIDLRVVGSDVYIPVIVQKEDANTPTFLVNGLTIFPHPAVTKVKSEVIYQQILMTRPEMDRQSTFGDPTAGHLTDLLEPKIPGLAKQALEIIAEIRTESLKDLGNIGPLAETLVSALNWATPLKYQEAIARTLSNYLAYSGKYTYSLSVKRQDQSLNPTEDFLKNTRAGHCELFASSLILMLRSLGIPSRMVVGYKGADYDGDGFYTIRQKNAHAWVEVLVPRLNSGGSPLVDRESKMIMDWVSLDPTPESMGAELEIDTTDILARLFQETQEATEKLWRTLFIDYNAESALEQLLQIWNRGPLRRSLILMIGAWVVVLLVAAILAFRKAWNRWSNAKRQRLCEYPWDLLLRIVGGKDLHPLPGQTPAEFAKVITRRLEQSQTLQAFAHYPEQLVENYQNSRFGNLPRTDQEAEDKRRLGLLRSKMTHTKW